MKIMAFIQSNNKQLLGAKVAKACIERNSNLVVRILNVDEQQNDFSNLIYKRGGSWVQHDVNSLQSFTLVRFLPPTLMEFDGWALVIDPDIFVVSDLSPLLEKINQADFDIAACNKKEAFDSSVMLMNCKNLRRLEWKSLIGELRKGELDYVDLMSLQLECIRIFPLDRRFNQLDEICEATVMFHTTNRLTQPWKTGLKIDFLRNNPGTWAGIPRKPFLKLTGKWPTRYQPHPNKLVEERFFSLVKLAINEGKLSFDDIRQEIALGNVRIDFLEKLKD